MTTPEVQEGAALRAAPRAPIGPIVAGVVLVAVGAFLLREAFGEIDGGELLIGGPRLAPIVVSAGWVAIATVYLVHQVIAGASARLNRRRQGGPRRQERDCRRD
jgi:hypothetical protein